MLYQNTPFIPFSYYLYEAHLGGEAGLDMGSVLNDKEPINFQVYLHVTFFLYSKIKDTIVLSSSCCCCISFLTVLASTQSSIWEWAPKLGNESWDHLVASTTEASTGAVSYLTCGPSMQTAARGFYWGIHFAFIFTKRPLLPLSKPWYPLRDCDCIAKLF